MTLTLYFNTFLNFVRYLNFFINLNSCVITKGRTLNNQKCMIIVIHTNVQNILFKIIDVLMTKIVLSFKV